MVMVAPETSLWLSHSKGHHKWWLVPSQWLLRKWNEGFLSAALEKSQETEQVPYSQDKRLHIQVKWTTGAKGCGHKTDRQSDRQIAQGHQRALLTPLTDACQFLSVLCLFRACFSYYTGVLILWQRFYFIGFCYLSRMCSMVNKTTNFQINDISYYVDCVSSPFSWFSLCVSLSYMHIV